MKRLLPVFVVIFLFALVSPINMITTGHQVFAAPEGTGGIVLVARDIGDGKTGSGNPVTRVYPSMGTYSAMVTASSSLTSLTASTVVSISEGSAGICLPLITNGETSVSDQDD